MRENALQRTCLNWLDSAYPGDVLALNVHGGGWCAKGFPDIVCCVLGRYVAIELKVGDNQPDSAQRVWARRICNAGGACHTARSLSEFQGIIENAIHVLEVE